MNRNFVFATIAGAVMAAAPLAAQGRGHDRGWGNGSNVPPGQMPPAGMCRIWIDGVPPGRQPRPTDCETARRNVPSNGRVIYGSQSNGDVYSRDGQRRDDDRYERERIERERIERQRERERRERDRRENGGYDRNGGYGRDSRTGTGTNGGVYGNGGTVYDGNRGNYPSAMPQMRDALQFRLFQYPAELRAWAGTDINKVDFDDVDGDKLPDTIVWRRDNTPVQRWVDTNHDGRADRVEILNTNGAVMQVVR